MTPLEELAEGQPMWLQEAILNGVNANSLFVLDPRLENFVNQLRENPESFSPSVVTAVVNSLQSPTPTETMQNERRREIERSNRPQRGPVENQFDQPQGQSAQDIRTAMADERNVQAQERAAAILEQQRADSGAPTSEELAQITRLRAQGISAEEYDETADIYKGLISPDALRRIWFDPVRSFDSGVQYQSISSMMNYFSQQMKDWETFVASPAGQAYLEENPDLPKNLKFSTGLNKLLPETNFGVQELTWSQAVQYLNNSAIKPELIERLNDILTAAGFYDVQAPSDNQNRSDPILTETWRTIVTESFLNDQSPDQFIFDRLDARTRALDNAFASFDNTTLAVRMDDIARTVLGRKLTSDEFETMKNTLDLFGSDSRELLIEGEINVPEQLAIYEQSIDEGTLTKLQASMQEQFAPQFERRYAYSKARENHAELEAIWDGRRNVDIPTLPDAVVNEGSA